MNLPTYLRRIGFDEEVRPDRNTLNKLMAAHLESVPFENLDQQLGRLVSPDISDAYHKVIERGRGGWCFELNALFAWLLSQIGFDVQTLAGHVGENGSAQNELASHLFLRVNCEQPLLVDVGFGGSIIEAVPLCETQVEQPPYTITISHANDGFMRFSERAGTSRASFDFQPQPVGDGYFDEVGMLLQTRQDSPFKRTLTAQRRYRDRHLVLRGRLLRVFHQKGVRDHLLDSADELVACLQAEFGLDVPEAGSIWPKIMQRHAEVFGSRDRNTQ